MMQAYLKIENPGVAPAEAFTLLGASTKRKSDNSATIGKFGTGNKQGIGLLLRHGLEPQIFCGSLKLGFTTREQRMDGHTFNRVVVKYGGKDATGTNRSATEDLGFVLEHGATDWQNIDMALREFVSNAIDRAVEEDERQFLNAYGEPLTNEQVQNINDQSGPDYDTFKAAHLNYRKNAQGWKNVTIEVVNEAQVRAKAGVTRVFIPLTPEVLEFHKNIGKWFLHFSEPELLNTAILPKKDRNLSGRKTAVIYRRGVRVREVAWPYTESLFDYNLEGLKLDESRNVDDYAVASAATAALARADEQVLRTFWQSLLEARKCWEQSFSEFGLTYNLSDAEKNRWNKTFADVAGKDAVLSTDDGGQQAARKGYKVIVAPQEFVQAARKNNVPTPESVLSEDEKQGREIMDSTPDAEAAVDFVWQVITKYKLDNGKKRPQVKTFRKIMDGGAQTLGIYRDGVVYINQDIAGNGALQTGWHNLTHQLLVTALEEVVHHVTQATDMSRDIQDYTFNLAMYLAKELNGLS
jgi:hypothetical protein